jgi:multiple sugar transport system substrate-binding protein
MSNDWPYLIGLAALLIAFNAWFFLRNRKTRILVSSYGDIQENRILINLISVFREKNPEIQVDLVRYNWGEYTREVLGSTQRGTGPDVVTMEVTHYTDFLFDGLLEPLNHYFMSDGLDINAYYPQVVDRFFHDGYLNAVPRDTAPVCMVYYNKKAFDEAKLPYPRDDWDWDQFVETAKKLKKVDPAGKVVRWGFVEGWTMTEAWVYDAGGSYVDEIKKPTRWTFCQDRNTLKGLQFRWDLIHKHKVMPPPSVWVGNNDIDSAEMFASGRAAMILFGLWKTPQFREIEGFQWDAAMIPREPSGHVDFNLGGTAYGIPKTTRNMKAAWKFVKFVSSEEGTKKLAEDGLSQPALMKVANSADFLDDKPPLNKKLVLAAMKHGKYAPLCRNWFDIKAILDRELTAAWEGKETILEALDRLRPMLESQPPQSR